MEIMVILAIESMQPWKITMFNYIGIEKGLKNILQKAGNDAVNCRLQYKLFLWGEIHIT